MDNIKTSNEITKLVSNFAIDTLKEINEECIKELMNYPRDKAIDEIEARIAWEKTTWFKIISNKIKEITYG